MSNIFIKTKNLKMKEAEGLKKRTGKPDYKNHLSLNGMSDKSITYNFYFFYFIEKSDEKVSANGWKYWTIKVSDGIEQRKFMTFLDFELKKDTLYRGLVEQHKENLVHIKECSDEIKKQIEDFKLKEKNANDILNSVIEEEYNKFKISLGESVSNTQARQLYKKELNYDQFSLNSAEYYNHIKIFNDL